ncbi:AraC family transcriptional regulator N-terminal domain-containing protein [Ancylobacter vacuolatus]|uniref:HTH araC/xylS-type domain-containing protein n=2 Tax=Ancylobacter vacuolatus TaxID=223389 RepID=A0ABU0DCB5_9HYPH|nr:hypothetical protein [Ancylobacter vacuolatus]
MECLVVSVALPGTGRMVKASETEPFVGLTADLDVAVVRDTVARLETLPAAPQRRPLRLGGADRRTFRRVHPASGADGRQPEGRSHPLALVMHDICYWLLSGPHEGEICKLSLPASSIERVAKAIHLLRDNIAQPMRVEQLAEAARISPSSFHEHFKTLTSMTPLQYQKQLGLLEARRRLRRVLRLMFQPAAQGALPTLFTATDPAARDGAQPPPATTA